MTKDEIIKILDMKPLDVEGGMWKGMFRSDERIPEGVFPGREGERDAYGSILYLLAPGSVSRMHRLASDEIWHFYMGAPCELLILSPDGTGRTVTLGSGLDKGESVTAVVPRGCWQGVRIKGEGEWALLGTTMAPAYEESDYEDGSEELLSEYPEFEEKIKPLLARP